MATLTIRKLDDAVYESLRAQAKANNRSIEAEARQLLGEQLRVERSGVERARSWFDEMREFRKRTSDQIGPQSDSVALIRAIRDEE